MLNSNQSVSQTTIDNRVLPTSGLITVLSLLQFSNKSDYVSPDGVKALIKECEKNGIFVLAIFPDPKTWLVCLDDFKNVSKNVTD